MQNNNVKRGFYNHEAYCRIILHDFANWAPIASDQWPPASKLGKKAHLRKALLFRNYNSTIWLKVETTVKPDRKCDAQSQDAQKRSS